VKEDETLWNRDILRIIDANCNRAAEGLRVIEEYARFVRNDAVLSGRSKALRHALERALHDGRIALPLRLASRDTSGDVGTSHAVQSIEHRQSPRDIAHANARRVAEALRAIEEYAKPTSRELSEKVATLRYQLYELERSLVRSANDRLARVRLCVLVTEGIAGPDWLARAELALKGGAEMLQLREKDLASGELLSRAKRLRDLCDRYEALLIVNDRPDIARLARADGVHVGQSDLSPEDARRVLDDSRDQNAIVGVSTHTVEQAMKAEADGADYLGIGPMFPSRTKPRDFVAGAEMGKRVQDAVGIPVLAIGGIDETNLSTLTAAGVRRIAVTVSVIAAPDPERAAARILAQLVGSAESAAES
jgi:thiamine-phosphate pyrophosphorylase